MATPNSILQADFTVIPLGDIGTTVPITPVTKTTDPITGDETLTSGTSVNNTVYIVRKDQGTWTLDKEGRIEGGDALMMTRVTATVNADDLVSWQSETYRVHRVLTRYAGDLAMYKVVNLFLRQ